ncbi:hypothetical protein CYV26_08505 [Carnobacterium maltaromaticum]|uniref:hypothetical protein n=1 Tax=Carnobacterium maltaromaticum TaxID=2751 RepID=UPI000C7749A3|nr:hypothetical protein [Carnobacterium maltaromaticum]PLS34482.1 hypothetical protein CYV30_11510 [Carnobacterium maltaromaticum]PLS34987.1 hypothetical protein CYV31_11490 [Carnobacterium maltaromaticum]PLS35400.1 hypothetical protein CYV33_08495 [Carnobacterium maltaromaticum]PLS41954.1 hypothetical protein CYV28_11445 [Carnobacterium maltaromaticum]PLS44789.1 hypothetical protein CYV27_08495 [Carnobacterium maltaromaticum]
MGTVEDYWEDVTIYYVKFVAFTASNSRRKHRKTLAFNSSVSKEDVYHLVSVYFNHIDEVLYVDELTDGLLLKEQ